MTIKIVDYEQGGNGSVNGRQLADERWGSIVGIEERWSVITALLASYHSPIPTSLHRLLFGQGQALPLHAAPLFHFHTALLASHRSPTLSIHLPHIQNRFNLLYLQQLTHSHKDYASCQHPPDCSGSIASKVHIYIPADNTHYTWGNQYSPVRGLKDTMKRKGCCKGIRGFYPFLKQDQQWPHIYHGRDGCSQCQTHMCHKPHQDKVQDDIDKYTANTDFDRCSRIL